MTPSSHRAGVVGGGIHGSLGGGGGGGGGGCCTLTSFGLYQNIFFKDFVFTSE